MRDQAIGLDYKLYEMNAKELSNRLKEQYNLAPLFLHLFNSNSGLSGHLESLEELDSWKELQEGDYRKRRIQESVEKIENGKHLTAMNKKGIEFGYELMPIAISAKGDIEDPLTAIELVDGFKRMFVMDDVPDTNVLVKVYEDLSDKDWINAMLVYNSWKFTDSEGSAKYMDRGFQLGLYHRYNLTFVGLKNPYYNMFRALDIYTVGADLRSFWHGGGSASGTFKTFWNNSLFWDDIQAISDIFNASPVFSIKKKGQLETYESTEKQFRGGGMNRLLEVFVSLLGEIRKYEYANQIEERKQFDRNIVKDYFADESLQKQFVKVLTMSVDGFIINHIQGHMREEIKKRVYEGMGYPYTPIEKKKPIQQKPFDITEIMV